MWLQAFSRSMALALLVTLSGCSIYSMPGDTPAPIETPPDYSEPENLPSALPGPDRNQQPHDYPPSELEAAYGPLIDRADEAAAKGDYEQALVFLERAQRIDPNSAEVYLAMARTHSARGDARQASATAERGLLYCKQTPQCDALRRYVR